MPRPQRLNIPGVPQHITQRGNNRQVCFFENKDRQTYLELLLKAAVRRGCSVHAYVLMSNHVHLLLTPDIADGVSHLMQDIGREYVRYINKTHQRSGTLWEGRFKSSLVDSEAYCLACYTYIELNPVRAAMVTSPQDYSWSSFHTNALGEPNPLITPHEQWLRLGEEDETRCRAYRDMCDGNMAGAQVETIRHTNSKGLPLGSKRFRAEIESQLKVKLGTGKVGRPGNQN